MKLYYTPFLCRGQGGGGARPVEEEKKYCEHSMFIYVIYTGSYSVMQCIQLLVYGTKLYDLNQKHNINVAMQCNHAIC